MTADLPAGIDEIMDYVGQRAEGYGYLKWNEVAMLKADMMNARARWMTVSPDALAAKCRRVGLAEKETAQVLDLLHKTQQGRRLVPQRSYRDFQFQQPMTPLIIAGTARLVISSLGGSPNRWQHGHRRCTGVVQEAWLVHVVAKAGASPIWGAAATAGAGDHRLLAMRSRPAPRRSESLLGSGGAERVAVMLRREFLWNAHRSCHRAFVDSTDDYAFQYNEALAGVLVF